MTRPPSSVVRFLCALLVASWTCIAGAADRVVFAVGSNSGLEHEEPLDFGPSDATEFSRLMVELGGVAPANVHLLLNPTRASLEAALQQVLRLVREDATLFFYYSGHGDETHLHVAGERISRRWIEAQLAAAPARLRIMFVDACRGLKERGFTAAEPFDIRNFEYNGLVLVQSASRGEMALESTRLQGGLFTRHLLSGLRGPADTNGDDKVSLDEAYTFAHGHTLADSGSAQVPVWDMTLRGSGTLELTTVIKTESRLRLPREAPARYTIFRKGLRSVFAEAWSSDASDTQIAIPAGEFVIWRRDCSVSAMLEAHVGRGVDRALSSDEFVAVDNEAMKERGGTLAVRQHRVTAVAGVVVSPRLEGDTGVGASVAADYAWVRSGSGWAPNLGLAFYREAFDAASSDVERDSYQALAGVLTPALMVERVAVRGGVGATATLTRETKRNRSGALDDEHSQFQRLGALLQLSASVPLSDLLQWTTSIAANPTAFRERTAAATRAPSAGLAASMAIFVATGVAFGF